MADLRTSPVRVRHTHLAIACLCGLHAGLAAAGWGLWQGVPGYLRAPVFATFGLATAYWLIGWWRRPLVHGRTYVSRKTYDLLRTDAMAPSAEQRAEQAEFERTHGVV